MAKKVSKIKKAKVKTKTKVKSEDIVINMGTPIQPVKTKKKKEEVIKCRCCGRSNKKCGYPTIEELYSLPSYFEGTYICGDCITEAGGPFGDGLELQQRVLILLNKNTDFGL